MPPKKTKFISITSADNKTVLPGRHRCECQATKHELVNNCLSCGRVVCSQEGKGPCFYCGELVLNRSERYRVLEGISKKTQSMIDRYSKLPRPIDDLVDQGTSVAVSNKERLLEYDRSSAQRTKVIDDQADYFASESVWLSDREKEAMKKREEIYKEQKSKLRRKLKVTIDFAGRKIIEEAPPEIDVESLSASSCDMRRHAQPRAQVDDEPRDIEMPEFVGTIQKTQTGSNALPPSAQALWSGRVQDAELQEVVDTGSCLSIQQPYATLVIDGIKVFEGRTWYTPFRGRLWISAGKKQPSGDLIKEVEACYKHVVEGVQFPTTYPVGCLLGCVDLIDCIPQEEYLELYPTGEIADPYVWVLANPKPLPFRIPMEPKPKIFKLEMHIHQAAKRALK